ncbi:MAG: phosphoribosylformylglycinamidine synthase subunit PurQ [Flavobacteriia bacterium]
MKFGVVTFPGSNCDQDMVYVLKDLMGQEVVELWHKDTDLQGADFIVIPGGFSYGDYLRSGAIAKFSPIMESVIAHANNGGYVMGVCNGFQILTESGLLEGALLHNDTQKFICKNVYLKPVSQTAAPTKDLHTDQAYQIPIAHGEGRFYADDATMASLQANDQILFTYCAADGSQDASTNPNGSLQHIAGSTNRNKNVFGMMPHPERAIAPELGGSDGLPMFRSLLEALA